MQIEFCPDKADSGLCSFASWTNDDLQAAIRRAFNQSPREVLYRLDITREGIRAYFRMNAAGPSNG